MKDSGLYQLTMYLPESNKIKIGKLGMYDFPKGYYRYTGSAAKGLQARVSRHLSKNKKKHWHIDYLLEYARVVDARLLYNPNISECELNINDINEDTFVIVKGFGSSDCRCDSHLIYLNKHISVL